MIDRYFILLFAVFLLVCVDAKATAVNEDNLTRATAWVEGWKERVKTARASASENMCDAKVDELLNVFIRFSNESLIKNVSQDDVGYLQETAFFAKNTANKNRTCFVHQVNGIELLLINIESRLKQ